MISPTKLRSLVSQGMSDSKIARTYHLDRRTIKRWRTKHRIAAGNHAYSSNSLVAMEREIKRLVTADPDKAFAAVRFLDNPRAAHKEVGRPPHKPFPSLGGGSMAGRDLW